MHLDTTELFSQPRATESGRENGWILSEIWKIYVSDFIDIPRITRRGKWPLEVPRIAFHCLRSITGLPNLRHHRATIKSLETLLINYESIHFRDNQRKLILTLHPAMQHVYGVAQKLREIDFVLEISTVRHLQIMTFWLRAHIPRTRSNERQFVIPRIPQSG